jgi:hypothetical protein
MPRAIGANDFCARLAGPAFEIVQPSFYVLPHSRAAWLILTERLQDLARRAERLSATGGRFWLETALSHPRSHYS